jgi:predicted homoserine dehydrogenase-like protein
MQKINRRDFLAGAPIRIAIIGCGSWGRTLLNRAGAVGGCEVAALCEPDANARASHPYRSGWEVA